MKNSSTIYPQISRYLYNGYLIPQLRNRHINNESSNFCMDGKDLRNIDTIDEYFYRLMLENEPNTIGSPLNIYLNEISNQLANQPLLLVSLPMWQLEKNKLRRYLPNYDNIIARINQKNNEVNTIYRRFINNPDSITGEELKKLLLFFSYCIPYADENLKNAGEHLAKILLNMRYENIYNYYIAVFLIKFFGYKKIREDGLDDTKIIIGSMQSNTLGLSINNHAVINKLTLQRTVMRNNILNDNYGRTNSGTEILAIMQTMYHELRHQKQSLEAKKGLANDISFFMGARNIIHSMDNSDFDYQENYRSYETEKDANIKGWEEVEKLIKTYMSNRNVVTITRNILKYKLNEELEQITGTRKNKDYQTYISTDLLVQYLDDAFRKKPSIITSEYTQFLHFYNKNGVPKRAIELFTQPLVYDYKEFYFGQVSYRSRLLVYQLTDRDIRMLTPQEVQTVIYNIKILININQAKLNKICDRVDKNQESSRNVVGNIKNYHNFAIYLSNLTNRIIAIHPRTINTLPIRNAIVSINENIDMINNNSIVAKIISNSNRIVRVGR